MTTDAVRALIDELRRLADDIARAGIKGFGNRATMIADELDAALTADAADGWLTDDSAPHGEYVWVLVRPPRKRKPVVGVGRFWHANQPGHDDDEPSWELIQPEYGELLGWSPMSKPPAPTAEGTREGFADFIRSSGSEKDAAMLEVADAAIAKQSRTREGGEGES